MTYRLSFDELKEFEEDLHRHVHLENNILFPRVREIMQVNNVNH
jgi:regulator of cell morphogenesis and NO signaling